MRHQNKRGRINRNISHRKATLKNLANSLFKYQRIETTLAKAKALRGFAEPLITRAKKQSDSLWARRVVYQKLCDRESVQRLFDELAPLFKDVEGGYTRIMPAGTRKGDGAEVAIIELTKRSVTDEELPGAAPVKKEAARKKKAKARVGKPEKAAPAEEKPEAEHHVAPEVDVKEKEEHVVEDVRKEKAKTEQKKVTKQGLFRRFRRKSMG